MLEKGGKYRELYAMEAAELDNLRRAGASKPDLEAARGALKAKYQKMSPPEVDKCLKAIYGDKYKIRTATGSFNPGATNPSVNQVAKYSKWGGRVFMVIMLYSEYEKIKSADDWARQLGSSSSGILGSVLVGWAAGAGAGFGLTYLTTNPWIIAGGTLIGGFVGGIFGYELFSGTYEYIYDIIKE